MTSQSFCEEFGSRKYGEHTIQVSFSPLSTIAFVPSSLHLIPSQSISSHLNPSILISLQDCRDHNPRHFTKVFSKWKCDNKQFTPDDPKFQRLFERRPEICKYTSLQFFKELKEFLVSHWLQYQLVCCVSCPSCTHVLLLIPYIHSSFYSIRSFVVLLAWEDQSSGGCVVQGIR